MSERVTRRLVAHGRVQGVGYRYAMQEEAARLGVHGWVRNRREGTVEAIVQGSPDAVEAITRWARQGPRGGSVSALDQSQAEGDFSSFEIRPSA